MNSKNNLTKKYSDKIKRFLGHFEQKKQFNIFWNKLTSRDQKLVILLLGANNNEPIPSLSHLKCELLLMKNIDGSKWTYGGIE